MKNSIRELREKNRYTQDALAKLVGVRRETIVFLEQGRYNPSLGLAHAIAKIFKKRIEDIFDFE